MNHYSHEIRAKALEIAIGLTGADHTWLRTDERGHILMKKPLYLTFQTVLRTIDANNLIPQDSDCKIYLEDAS